MITKEFIDFIEGNYENLKINEISKIGFNTVNDVFKMSTSRGDIVLKIYSSLSLKEIQNSLERQILIYTTFKGAPRVYENEQRKYVSSFNKEYFSLQEYVYGEHPSSEYSTIDKVARKLSKIHRVFKDIKYTSLKSQTKIWNETVLEIEQFERNVESYFNHYGESAYLSQLIELLSIRKNIAVKQKIVYQPSVIQVIHGDYRPLNILINSNNDIFSIDFDFTAVADLWVEVGRSAILLADYDIGKINAYLESYCSESRIEPVSIRNLFGHILSYLVQSHFPVKIHEKLTEESVVPIINERLRLLDFCLQITK